MINVTCISFVLYHENISPLDLLQLCNSNHTGRPSLTLSGTDVQHGGNILTTDIGNSSENGLICSYPSGSHMGSNGWYHKLTETSDLGDRELQEKGWSTNRERDSFHEMYSLFKTPGSAAKEGMVTCVTSEGSISVNIYHPSELPSIGLIVLLSCNL